MLPPCEAISQAGASSTPTGHQATLQACAAPLVHNSLTKAHSALQFKGFSSHADAATAHQRSWEVASILGHPRDNLQLRTSGEGLPASGGRSDSPSAKPGCSQHIMRVRRGST